MKNSDWYRIVLFCKPYFKKTWLKFGIILFIIAAGAIVSNGMPLLWGNIIDCLAGAEIRPLTINLILYFSTTYMVYALGAIEGYLGAKLNFEIESKIRKEIFEKVLQMNCSDLDEFDTGELVSRVSSDSGSVITFAINAIASIVTIAINIFAATFFLFRISIKLSIASVVFIPLSIATNFIFKSAYRSLGEQQKQYSDRVSSFLVNTLGHIPDTKAYRMEEQQNSKYRKLIHESWELQKRGFVLSNKSSIVSSLITSASTIVTIIMSAAFVHQGLLTIGNVVSFQNYIEKLKSSVSQLLQMNYSAQTACVAINRIQEIFEKATDISEGKDCLIQISSIEYDNVSFAYRNRHLVLDKLCFNINGPGVYAFVGKNGCGKTTILKVLMRYYPIEHGNIQINRKPISEFSTGTTRRSIIYYAKNAYIQNASIKENLLLGSKYSSSDSVPDEIIVACQKIGIADFINQLPNGYETEVLEDGKILSSGQKQKIAVIRAMQSDASVILFDEITSDLDGASEKAICEVLDAMGREKIVVLVTHRINSVRRAKQIMVVDGGHISAIGTHHSLLKDSETYRYLFEQQANNPV